MTERNKKFQALRRRERQLKQRIDQEIEKGQAACDAVDTESVPVAESGGEGRRLSAEEIEQELIKGRANLTMVEKQLWDFFGTCQGLRVICELTRQFREVQDKLTRLVEEGSGLEILFVGSEELVEG